MSARLRRHSAHSGTREWVYARRFHELRLERGNRCARCGARGRWKTHASGRRDYTLQFAHVAATGLRGRGRGVRKRYLDVRDSPGSYELLCRRCHLALDRAQRAAGGAEGAEGALAGLVSYPREDPRDWGELGRPQGRPQASAEEPPF